MQLFYGKPSDDNIEAYIEELVILLVNKCLKMVEYGFKRGDSWVVVARYTVQSDGTSLTDDRSGRVPAGANTSSALWHSFLEYNGAWFSLSENERQRIRNSLPFQRTDGNDLFDAVEEYPSYMPTQLDEIKSLRAYIQSSGVGARLCPAPHAGRLALGQNLGSLLHCHGAGQQRLVVQVLRPMHQHGDPTPWGRWWPAASRSRSTWIRVAQSALTTATRLLERPWPRTRVTSRQTRSTRPTPQEPLQLLLRVC